MSPWGKIQPFLDWWMNEWMNTFVIPKDLVTREATAFPTTMKDRHSQSTHYVMGFAGDTQETWGISPFPKWMISTPLQGGGRFAALIWARWSGRATEIWLLHTFLSSHGIVSPVGFDIPNSLKKL